MLNEEKKSIKMTPTFLFFEKKSTHWTHFFFCFVVGLFLLKSNHTLSHLKRHKTMSGDEEKFERIRLGFGDDSEITMKDFNYLGETDLETLLGRTTSISDRGTLKRIWKEAQQQCIVFSHHFSITPAF